MFAEKENNHALFINPIKSEKLLVICSDAACPPPRFNLFKKAQILGVNVLFLNTTPNKWYRTGIDSISDEMKEKDGIKAFKSYMDKIKKKYDITRTYFMGFSMGAYGALLLGSVVNSDSVLFISGEPVLGIPGGKTERTRNRYWHLHSDLRSVSVKKVISIFGTLDIADNIGAYLVQSCSPSCLQYSLSYAEHDLTERINERGLLDAILKDFVSDRLENIDSTFTRETVSKEFFDYLMILNEYINKKDYPKIEYIIEKQKDKWLDRAPLVKFILVVAFKKQGKIAEARKYLYELIDIEPRFYKYWNLLASILREEKQYESALVAIDVAIALRPRISLSLHIKSIILKEQKQYAKALFYGERAVEINSKIEMYSENVKKLRKHLNDSPHLLVPYTEIYNDGFEGSQVIKRLQEAKSILGLNFELKI